jgi:hypothetical protein
MNRKQRRAQSKKKRQRRVSARGVPIIGQRKRTAEQKAVAFNEGMAKLLGEIFDPSSAEDIALIHQAFGLQSAIWSIRTGLSETQHVMRMRDAFKEVRGELDQRIEQPGDAGPTIMVADPNDEYEAAAKAPHPQQALD